MINTKKNYLFEFFEPFKCVQMNEYYWIELLVLNNNTWNSLIVGLNWIIGIT